MWQFNFQAETFEMLKDAHEAFMYMKLNLIF